MLQKQPNQKTAHCDLRVVSRKIVNRTALLAESSRLNIAASRQRSLYNLAASTALVDVRANGYDTVSLKRPKPPDQLHGTIP